MLKRTNHTPRGFAMMLVIISLAVATILATAYLASRDNSSIIGANTASGSSAKWAALTALKSGIAVLETETDWRNNHTNGVVFANASLAGASIDLKLMDLATGTPPCDETTDVEITATARMNGMTETVVARAYVPPADNAPALDLGEFAVFGKDKIEVTDTSLITRWSSSPRAKLGKVVQLGTASTLAGAVSLTDLAVAVDSKVYKTKGASSILVSNSGPGSVTSEELPDVIVVPNPPSSGVSEPTTDTKNSWTDVSRNNGATATITNTRNIKNLTINSNAIVTMRGPITVTIGGNLSLDNGGRIIVQGAVKLVVFGDMSMMHDASIQLEDGATLEMWSKGKIDLEESSIKEADGALTRDTSGDATYFSPSRVNIYSYDATSNTWTIKKESVVKARIYAPSNRVDITEKASLYGAVLAKDVRINKGGTVYYDHTLDKGAGYTVYDSSIYDSDGKVRSIIKSVSDLNTATINTVNVIIDLLTIEPIEIVGVGDPTPRTVAVSYEIVSVSSDIASWESKASMIAAGSNDDDDDILIVNEDPGEKIDIVVK